MEMESSEMSSCLPDARAFVAALNACSSIASKEEFGDEIGGKIVKPRCLETGMAIHSRAVKLGCGGESNKFVASALVDMYSSCGSLLDARIVFDRCFERFIDDVVLWNAMLHAYVENGESEIAVRVFESMRRIDRCAGPNARTYSILLKACSNLAAIEDEDRTAIKVSSLERGMALHCELSEQGFETDSFVSSTLMSMYASCGSMADARGVFDRMLNWNVFSWTVLVLGYASNGEEHTAVQCLEAMRSRGLAPESPTFVAALKACRCIETTLAVHAEIIRSGVLFQFDSPLATSIMDVYGRYGAVERARRIFDSLPSSSRSRKAPAVTWTAVLAGLSRSGENERALDLFEGMLAEGVCPDATTLQCVLSSCSHAGRIQAGKRLFESMERKFGIRRGVEHYVCMVDLLCRANELEAALELWSSMPLKPTAVGWTILLAGCEKWKNLEIGRVAFQALLEMEAEDGSGYAYVLMENICKHSGDAN